MPRMYLSGLPGTQTRTCRTVSVFPTSRPDFLIFRRLSSRCGCFVSGKCPHFNTKAREKKWSDEEAGMRSQFQQREALTEQTVIDRKVLADNNIIRINKETRQKIKGTESEWQGRASKWLATARRKVKTCCACCGRFQELSGSRIPEVLLRGRWS